MPTIDTFFDSEDSVVDATSPDAVKLVRAEWEGNKLIKETWFFIDTPENFED